MSFAASNVQADAIITTVPDWNGSSAVSAFGYGASATATYGETITATDANKVLTSFTFEMKMPATTTFRGYVYGWNGSMATEQKFASSSDRHTILDNTSFEPSTFSTGGIELTPGLSYVLFASTTGTDPGGIGQGIWGQTQMASSYAGGEFVFINNTNMDQLTNSQWTKGHLGPGADL